MSNLLSIRQLEGSHLEDPNDNQEFLLGQLLTALEWGFWALPRYLLRSAVSSS